MSIHSNKIKPAVPPKPKTAPKPDLQGERWRRATDIIHRPEAGEEAAEDRKRLLAKHKSLPAVVNDNPTLETPASPVSVRPTPKPRRRWTEEPQNNQSLFEGRVNGEKSVYEHQSRRGSTDSSINQSTCQSSCPCVCHHTHECEPKHDAHKLESPSEEPPGHLEYWHIAQPEKPRRVPPSIPLPCLPLLEMPEPSLSTTGEGEDPDTLEAVYDSIGECEDPDILEAVHMEVSPDSKEQHSPMTSAPTESSITNVAVSTSQSGNAKPLPCPRRKSLQTMMNMSCKITDSIHPDHQDMELICDVLNELPKAQDCLQKQEIDTEQSKRKKNCGRLLRKLSHLELMLFPSQNKSQANQAANQKGFIRTGSSQKSSKKYTGEGNSPKEQSVSNTEQRSGSQEETSSFAPEEEPEEGKLEASKVVPRRGRRPTLQEGLWRDRTIVKKRGILSQLSKEQLLLHESLYEVVTSERTYLKSLDVVVELFVESPELNQVLSPRDHKCLFSDISKIQQMSENFLKDMEDELTSNLFCDTCEVIQRYAIGPFGAYVDYIRNLPYQEQTLHNLERRSPQVSEILRKLQKDPRCNRLPLKSFLVLPFQRITRLKILVEAILKKTEPGSQGQASAERALKDVSKIVEACNHEVGRMKQMEEMVNIANNVEFECKALPLVSSSRWLLKQGDLAQLSVKENIFGQRKLNPIHLFLFNDVLLVTTRKGPDRFVVRDHVHRSLIEVSSVEDDADLDGCEHDKTFQLALLQNHRGSISHLLLQAPSQAEKASWVGMLTQRKDGEEDIYEEWDCPQVQCTVAYQAQHQGELSLQPGEVINVIQKTSEGFLEGRRMDGERGWFPAACAVEILNEHVQRRHLRQRYHVLQAASRVLYRRLGNDKSETACL